MARCCRPALPWPALLRQMMAPHCRSAPSWRVLQLAVRQMTALCGTVPPLLVLLSAMHRVMRAPHCRSAPSWPVLRPAVRQMMAACWLALP
jgi:hypothetical protein